MSSKNISDIFCPLCGAAAHFDIIHQNYKCSYCEGKVTIKEAIKEKQGFRELHQKKIKEDAKNYKLLTGYCSGCGATVVFEENEPMTTCAFCGKALVRKEYTNDEELPELLIPFRITEDEAKNIAKEWCESNKNKIEAKHFSERISNIKGFYLPYELIRGSVSCSTGRKDSSSSYTCRGNVAQEFINRSKQLDNLLLDAMEPFELDDLKEFDFAYLAGQRVKVSDIDNYELNKRICDELEVNYRKELKKTFKTEALDITVFTDSMLRMPVLLPVYYICDGNFMAVINGQTGKVSVRAEKDSYYYFLPWWLKAILSTLIISFLVYLTMTILGAEKGLVLTASGGLAIVIGIISLCLYLQDSKKNAFKELAGRKIFSSKSGPYRRTEIGLVKDKKELKRERNIPVFFHKIYDEERPVEYVFYSFFRLFPLYFAGFVLLFLPVILALFLNNFDFQKLTLSGSAIWFCIFVPIVPTYLLKFIHVNNLYDSPLIYIIKENGKKERYGENSISIFKAFNYISDLASEQYGCFVVGFLLLLLFINTYITAFGYGEGKEQTAIKEQIVIEKTIDKKSEITSSQSNNSKTYLDKTNNSTEKVNDKKSEMTFSQVKDLKTTLSKISDSAEKNNSISSSTAKQKIELLPLKQNNIIIHLLNTKEYFFLGTGEDNTYYSSMHYTPEKKLDWFVYSVNIDEKCRLYFYKVKGENENKKSEKYVYLFIKDNGFEISDLEKNLLWTIEKKDSDYYLKRGHNKEFTYRFGVFKQKSSTVMNCYMVVNAENKPQSISWKKEDGLYVLDANYKTKFYIPKCNPNSKNEPALAFPNIYMIEEMDIKLRNIIAIEMSQLE